MSVAEKLCSDIVGPILNGSSSTRRETAGASVQTSSNNHSNGNVQPASTRRLTDRAIVLKQRDLNNLGPYLQGKEGKTVIVVNKIRSDESLVRTYLDAASNTIISGPVKCIDNDCVTKVRQRPVCRCNYAKRQCLRVSSKFTQTTNDNSYYMNRACDYHVDMVTRGTQFFEKLLGGIHKQTMMSPAVSVSKETMISQVSVRPVCVITENVSSYRQLSRYSATNRWAISHSVRPSRGPDF